MNNKLIVSTSPHISSPVKTRNLMLDVIIALMPALVASVIFFGPRAILIEAVSVATCVVCEYICRKIMKRENTIGDLSAVVTGLLLAFNLPSSVPIYVPIIGGGVAIVVAKQMFGGIGQNFVNPALFARIVLMNSFPTLMTTWWAAGNFGADTTATASILANIKAGAEVGYTYLDAFLGNVPGCLGETSALAILIGGIYLICRKVIKPVIPLVYIVTVFVLSAILGLDPLMQILAGGLFIGAFFMATDYVTSPLTVKGKIIYALAMGVMTTLIRRFASLPEGVSYSILLLNIIVPLIERKTVPLPFGAVKEPKKAKEESK
ncbi:MAG: RnfABCDGE type electron transport complex subunit D [Lachnospiraceae bacterium]|nr:RnfABCDGE type electron transport complex subunit D [Lachnospiraceae bacterium]